MALFKLWIESVRDLGVEFVGPRSVGATDHASFDSAGIPGLPVHAGAARVQLAHASLEHGFRRSRPARGPRAAGHGRGRLRVVHRELAREAAAQGSCAASGYARNNRLWYRCRSRVVHHAIIITVHRTGGPRCACSTTSTASIGIAQKARPPAGLLLFVAHAGEGIDGASKKAAMDFAKAGRTHPGGRAGCRRVIEVLMVGFMNDRGLGTSRSETGYVTFFSRTRNTLWTKGETSGNRLAVKQLFVDCDEDTVLIKARREGDGNVCHTGARTLLLHRGDAMSAGSSSAPARLRLGIPKGSLEASTVQLFDRAGFKILDQHAVVLSLRSTIPRSSACSSARRRWRATSAMASSTPGSPAWTGSPSISSAIPKKRRSCRRGSGLREAEFRQGEMGARRTGRLAVQDALRISTASGSPPSWCASPSTTSRRRA